VEGIGLDANGENSVSFYVQATRTAYDATWPQPFFELARAALLGGKKLSVVSNGDLLNGPLAFSYDWSAEAFQCDFAFLSVINHWQRIVWR
jgi:hypothetical protein